MIGSLLQILEVHGRAESARVFVAGLRGREDLAIEFVDALDPRYPVEEKWVAVLSTQIGCPVGCPMCDAGGGFRGNLTVDEILAQIDTAVWTRFHTRMPASAKCKLQFARMGEPALNPAVLDVLRLLPERYPLPGLIPCLATVAPLRADDFFEQLLDMRYDLYRDLDFQLQFSINSTDPDARKALIPYPIWDLERIGTYARAFRMPGKRKVALNFALSQGVPVEPKVLARFVPTEDVLIKLTPVNPTFRATENGIATALATGEEPEVTGLVARFMREGFDVLVSVGSAEEITIGSNCGQYIQTKRNAE